jgi:hypothetical protein
MGIYESIREERDERISRRFKDREPAMPRKFAAVRNARWAVHEASTEMENSMGDM